MLPRLGHGPIGGGVRQSGYFLVVASPALPVNEKNALPRRVVLVMDRSGSMQGKKIEHAWVVELTINPILDDGQMKHFSVLIVTRIENRFPDVVEAAD